MKAFIFLALLLTTGCNPIDKIGTMVLYPFKSASTTPPEGVIEKKITLDHGVVNVQLTKKGEVK